MDSSKSRPSGAAFLLAQVGARGADRFGERIAVLGISLPHAGILRIVHATPACNQQELARMLGVLPSRMVILIDELVEKGLIERKRSTKDRRHSELVLTVKGERMMEKLSRMALEHEADLCAALTLEERETLAELCQKIARQQGLTPGVHPGYKKLE